MTCQICDERSLLLPRMGASFLLLVFLVSFARVPLAYGHDSSAGRTNFAAVIFDGDSVDRHDPAGGPEGISFISMDGCFSGPLLDPIYSEPLPVPSSLLHVPFILPMRFVHTQITSSDL